MINRELLEMAAKASGFSLPGADDSDEIGRQYEYHLGLWVKHSWGWGWFRPHINGEQALRLAVELNIEIKQFNGDCIVKWGKSGQPYQWCSEPLGADPFSAVLRAIVRAAAKIGKSLA